MTDEKKGDFLESDFYTKGRDFSGRFYTDERFWFIPFNLLIRREKDDSIREIIVQYEGSKLEFCKIVVEDGKLVIK